MVAHPSDKKPWLFKPGQSGNPGGRNLGIEAKMREWLKDDWEAMTHVMRDIVLGRMPQGINDGVAIKTRDRIEAWKALNDRALGKAKITVDVNQHGSPSGAIDVEGLTPEEFKALDREMEGLLTRARRPVLDVVLAEEPDEPEEPNSEPEPER